MNITKKAIITLTAALSLTIGAGACKADLHDTYAQSCAKYGGEGYVQKDTHSIVWHVSHHVVGESFVKNECVRMTLIPDDPNDTYAVDQIEKYVLPAECGNSQTWNRYDGGGQYVQTWETTDGLILAALYQDGSVQVAYKWWIKAKGLLTPPVKPTMPPVEDDPANGSKPETPTPAPVTFSEQELTMQQLIRNDIDPRHIA